MLNELEYETEIIPVKSTGDIVLDTITDETTQVMKNLKAVLKAADMTFDNVVKTSIFLSDMNNFKKSIMPISIILGSNQLGGSKLLINDLINNFSLIRYYLSI